MKTKITIVGLGGVGGYYGAMLARKYKHSENIEICFLARGMHQKQIKVAGLGLVREEQIFISYPSIVTDKAAEIGVSDYVLLAVKSYDLEAVLEQIKPLVGANTVLLPLLNGIDNVERIQKKYPENEVWWGCTYLVGRVRMPGLVENMGASQLLCFGSDVAKTPNNSEQIFKDILKEANIDVNLSSDILSTIWRKFFFISIAASLTSYFDVGFVDLLDEERKETFKLLFDELLTVAKAEEVTVADNLLNDLFLQLARLPKGVTSSMHNDFKTNHKTELDSLTGIVIKLAEKHNIDVPNYTMVYEELKGRENK